jgi:hypothetical protein
VSARAKAEAQRGEAERLERPLPARTAWRGLAVKSSSTRPSYFHHPNNDCQNGAASTAANNLADERTNIEVSSRRRHRQGWNQCLQDLSTAGTANRARDGIAERSEIVVLERSTG